MTVRNLLLLFSLIFLFLFFTLTARAEVIVLNSSYVTSSAHTGKELPNNCFTGQSYTGESTDDTFEIAYSIWNISTLPDPINITGVNLSVTQLLNENFYGSETLNIAHCSNDTWETCTITHNNPPCSIGDFIYYSEVRNSVQSSTLFNHSLNISGNWGANDTLSLLFYWTNSVFEAHGEHSWDNLYIEHTPFVDSCTPPAAGDWNITDGDNCECSESLTITGDLIIDDGGLLFKNGCILTVSGGEIYIYSGNLTFEQGGQVNG